MTTNEIIDIQKRIGVNPDGVWGSKSIAAAKKHLKGLMSNPLLFPKQSQNAYRRYFGLPGDTTQHVKINVVGLGLIYDDIKVKTVTCHNKVAESLLNIFIDISESEYKWILEYYGGVYNFRPARGAEKLSLLDTSWSLHAYAAATDLWSKKNGNKSHYPLASSMPFGVMEIFAKHNWIAAGVFWGRDAMHFQATQ